jgi:hypothetical protein
MLIDFNTETEVGKFVNGNCRLGQLLPANSISNSFKVKEISNAFDMTEDNYMQTNAIALFMLHKMAALISNIYTALLSVNSLI